MSGHLRTVAGPAIALAAMVALTGCGAAGNTGTASGSSSSASPPGTSTSDLSVADSALGRIVVTRSGMTAYVFTKDTPNSGRSACTGPCLQAWPPVTTASGTPSADGVTGKLATITLSDGRKQVTLEGRPLYLFAKDTKAGDVKGQGVKTVWYAVSPDGSMVTGGSNGGGY
ncbi:COG4315 family predicted lipoprotein [Pedococcus sp. 5OH_020]|uniref:COG4315 family predicted lipoprotein n=1 Tax=Pedococcus sp. 5OH_020 TaxID=2989814 RepID=UPI0022E9FF96|nr:hypothetical protein [Pedococcus sp. 5OH_020]